MSNSDKKVSKNTDMEALLNDENAPKLPKVGDVAQGNIIEIGSNIIYVDLGPIGTGAIYGYGKSIISTLSSFKDLKPGTPIAATITDRENEDGFVEMSLKQTSMDMIWKELERKMDESEIVTTKVLEANKGGLMIKVNGMVGFLPASQLSSDNYPRVSDGDKNKILSLLMQLVGKDIRVKIIGIDKNEGKLIVSEKATREKEEHEKISTLKVGDVVEGEISGIVDFGAFVKFNGTLEGLVHISELAWKLIDDPRKIFNVGQKVRCKIIGIDDSRISLSIKALEEDPWKNVAQKYQVGQKVKGEVTKVNPFGAFVQLDKDIHGLAHVSKLGDDSGLKNMEVGKTYEFEIISIEPQDHRLGLKPILAKKAVKIENKEQKTVKPEETKAVPTEKTAEVSEK